MKLYNPVGILLYFIEWSFGQGFLQPLLHAYAHLKCKSVNPTFFFHGFIKKTRVSSSNCAGFIFTFISLSALPESESERECEMGPCLKVKVKSTLSLSLSLSFHFHFTFVNVSTHPCFRVSYLVCSTLCFATGGGVP